MPYLEESKNILQTGDETGIYPRLQTGKAVYQKSKAEYIYLPSLTNAEAEIFGATESLKTVWLPQLETMDGTAFKDSAVTSMILESINPPKVTGVNPFNGLNENRTVYVPTELVEAYQTADDGDNKDGKWYGWNVEPMENATAATDLLSSCINGLQTADITIHYSDWIHAIERAIGVLDSSAAAEVKAQLATPLNVINAVEADDAVRIVGMIDSLGAPEELKLEDASTVKAARAAYERLNEISKAKVTNIDKLVAAEGKIEILSIHAVQRGINSLPEDVTEENKGDVRSVYADYLALSEEARQQIQGDDLAKLSAAIDQVVQIERDILTAQNVIAKITTLPVGDELLLAHEGAVTAARNAYNTLSDSAKDRINRELLETLEAAEAKIAELKTNTDKEKTITLSVEKFVLGRGYITTPVKLEVKEGDTLASLLLSVLGNGNYKHSGKVNDSFYLQSVKDNDTSAALIPDYISQRIEIAGEELSGRSTANWLAEFDYTSMAGWMFTVNHVIPQKSAADFDYATLKDGDVVRWQFSVFGYGADLGHASSVSAEPFINVANKDALTAKIADVDGATEKLAWLADEDYKAVYDNAYAVMQKMDATQAEVDDALTALAETPDVSDLGTVSVTVQDIVPRRQSTQVARGDTQAYMPLTNLGDYQNSFGVLLSEVQVPVKAGMTVRDAVVTALEANGYSATLGGNANGINAIGPVVKADRSGTVESLGTSNAGSISKWVLTQNDTALSNQDAVFNYTVESGDVLTMEYTVDGGDDIGCSPVAYTTPLYNYGDEARLSGSTLYLPEGTTELSVDVNIKNAESDAYVYSRYAQSWVTKDGVRYKNNEPMAVEAGTQFKINNFNPPGAGTAAIVGGYGPNTAVRETTRTIAYYKSPSQVEAMINNLPGVEAIKYGERTSVTEARTFYNILKADEKAMVSEAATNKLTDLEARISALTTAFRNEAAPVTTLLTKLPVAANVTPENYEQYADQITAARAAYDALSEDAKTFVTAANLKKLTDLENKIYRWENPYVAPLGTATNYPNDFMLTNLAFNLNLDDDPLEVVFFDTPRISQDDQANNRSDLVLTVGDEDIVEVKLENKPNPNNQAETLDHYYLVPKAEGTTTIRANYPEFEGQIPEIVVHVNNINEKDVENELTNINALARKYDCWHYWDTEDGTDFTFKVNGSNASVEVLNYLGTGSTRYTPDADGNVTVRLTDGYNPIVVTATLNGKTVTQAYGVKAKAISYKLTNVTNPASETFKEGDTVSLNLTGLNTAVYKISRIYNPSGTGFAYETDMPRYTTLESGGGQYEAGAMEFVLTGAGEFSLKDGYCKQVWFGSGLYSELPVGTAPPNLNAGQPKGVFPHLPEFKINVEENPDYKPNVVEPAVVGGNYVQAGETVTINIPDLDTTLMKNNHTTASSSNINDVIEAYTTFATDIPGKDMDYVKSEKAVYYNEAYYGDKANDTMDNLKTITFTVPEDTPAGEFHLRGGNVDTTYGVSFWLKFKTYFNGEINDITITVVEEDVAKVENAIAALPAPADATLENEMSIKTAQIAFNALGTDKQAQIKEATKTKLTKLLEKLDTLHAEAVTALVADLGEIKELEQKDSVEAARKAYDTLTDTQKGLLAEETLQTLIAAETKIAMLQRAADVTTLINALDVKSLADQEAVEAARAAYDALTDDELDHISASTVKKLTQAEAKLAELLSAAAVEAVTEQIAALPTVAEMTLADEVKVTEARAAYDKLSAAQKALVENVDILTAAEARIAELKAAAGQEEIDKAAAKAVDDKITALGEITLAKETAVIETRSAFDALTEVQKALVTKLEALTAAEAKIAELKGQATNDKEAAEAVIKQIADLGEIVSLDQSQAVADARKAYDELSATAKALVPEASFNALNAAEKKIAELEAQAGTDEKAALAVREQITALTGKELTLSDEAALIAVRNAYNTLSEAQKALVTNAGQLDELDAKMAELKTAATDEDIVAAFVDQVEKLPMVTELTRDDASKVATLQEMLAGLTDEQKALIDPAVNETIEAAIERIAEIQAADEAAIKAVKESIESLPKDTEAKDLTNEDRLAILAALDTYAELEEALKPRVDKTALDVAKAKLRAANHQAIDGKVSVRDDNILEDHIAIVVEDHGDESLAALKEALASGETDVEDIILSYNTWLQNLRDGSEHQLAEGQSLTVTIDAGKNLTAVADRIRMAHHKADGTIEFIRPIKVKGQLITFEATSFSPYSLVTLAQGTTDPGNSGGDGNAGGGQSGGGQNQSSTAGSGSGSATKTRDETNLPLYILLLALSGVALVVVKRRSNA